MIDDLTPPHWDELPYSATGDVVETLARAIYEAAAKEAAGLRQGVFVVPWEMSELSHPHYIKIAAALHAQIAPTLRAEGIDRAGEIYATGENWDTFNAFGAALRAEAKRLREGGEG